MQSSFANGFSKFLLQSDEVLNKPSPANAQGDYLLLYLYSLYIIYIIYNQHLVAVLPIAGGYI